MEKVKNPVKTTFRCSRCRKRLVIVERGNVTLFGCPRCDCYVVLLPWQLREFRRGNFFNWRGLMKYAYNVYLDARDSVCQ
jgi:hypothetical protein